MGAWAGQPNIGGQSQGGLGTMPQQGGGDAPAFDLPPPPQMPMVGGSGPMPPQPNMPSFMPPQPMPYNRTPGGGDGTFRDPGIGYDPYPNAGFLKDLYRQELGRRADNGGMNYWLQQMANGMSQDQIRQMLDQSEEGQAYNQRPAPDYVTPLPEVRYPNDPRNPPTGLPPLPNREAIQQIYRDQLGREADQEGLNYWLGQMNEGLRPDQIVERIGGAQEAQNYRKNKPFDWTTVNARPPMDPQIVDALRLVNQRGQQSPPEGRLGGGVGGPHMPQGLRSLFGGMLPPQPNYNPVPPSQEELDYSQRLGKDPFSPEVQDALRIAKGLPVY